MNITKKIFSFTSKYDQVIIRGVCFIPDKPIGILQMVHGMCEHKERFIDFMEYMAELGYITLMHDNRGHGASVKKKDDIGYCYSSMEKGYVEDIYAVTRRIKKEFSNLPLILYGHSMGSLGVRAYLQKHDDLVDGLIISGCPAYNDAVIPAAFIVKRIAKITGERCRFDFLQNLVMGSFERRFWHEHRKFAWLATDENVALKFQQDERCVFIYTLNGLLTLLNLEKITYLQKNFQMKHKELPILFISGKDDPCYINERKWEHAINRMKNLGYNDISEIRYENMRHEIHNEPANEIVFEDMNHFCKRIITQA